MNKFYHFSWPGPITILVFYFFFLIFTGDKFLHIMVYKTCHIQPFYCTTHEGHSAHEKDNR